MEKGRASGPELACCPSAPHCTGDQAGKPTQSPRWKLQKETDVLIRRIFEIISFQRKISQLKCQISRIHKQKTDATRVPFETNLGITLPKLRVDIFKQYNS